MPQLPLVEIMSRRQCHLCDEAKLAVARAAGEGLCTWHVMHVDDDARLLKRYGLDVPVVLINGKTHCKHHVDLPALRQALAAGGASC